ncbi:MAG TPA: hypothetical protein VJW73_08225 [Gemmatimonadaceae bacterium]|nr:hypothetical protein [Gemmatimonadaceae bacterium]
MCANGYDSDPCQRGIVVRQREPNGVSVRSECYAAIEAGGPFAYGCA